MSAKSASKVSVMFLYRSGHREIATVGESVTWTTEKSTEFDDAVATDGADGLDAALALPEDIILLAEIRLPDRRERITNPDAAIVFRSLLKRFESPVAFLPLMKLIRPKEFRLERGEPLDTCPPELESVRKVLNAAFRQTKMPVLVKGIRKSASMLKRVPPANSKPPRGRSRKNGKKPR